MTVEVNGNIVSCDGETFGEIDLYNPSEDWMGLQLDYSRYAADKGDNMNYGRRFGVGGIEFHQITPSTFDVYSRDMDSAGEEHFLFNWRDEYDATEYDTDGDYKMSAEFFWTLCHAVEEHYGER